MPKARTRRFGDMEIPNIHTIIDGRGPHRVDTRSASGVSCPAALLLLSGDPDESEQQEHSDQRERSDGLVAGVDSGEAHGSGEDEGRDSGIPDR